MLDEITHELFEARTYYKWFVPAWPKILKGNPGRALRAYITIRKHRRMWLEGKRVPEQLGIVVGTKIIYKSISPASAAIMSVLDPIALPSLDPARPGQNKRTWIETPGRYPLVVVFHDANRAGPHLDVHIGDTSVIYRVKPELYSQLKYRNGVLTQASKSALIAHIRGEIDGHSRVPQNLDHNLDEARTVWVNGGDDMEGYGAGKTRQIILESEVDVFKTGEGQPMEMVAPAINPDHTLYLYQLYPGTDTKAPILVFGSMLPAPPSLEDRLHLRLIQPEDEAKLLTKADLATTTAKYDGASAYIHMTTKGTRIYSPRKSVVTGHQIEYTGKLNGLARSTAPETVVAMGEVMMVKHSKGGRKEYLPAATVGGILNSHGLIPDEYEPEIRIYRVDRVGRKHTKDLPFWENRALAEQVATLDPHLEVVELMSPDQAKAAGFEGFVVVPPDKSVNEGYKLKYWDDPSDWRITAVHFEPGPKGGIAGVVALESLESHKHFKLGPGQMGDATLCKDMMANPDDYIGRVVKVNSKQGHEGRAAKVVMFHDDK